MVRILNRNSGFWRHSLDGMIVLTHAKPAVIFARSRGVFGVADA